MNEKTTIVVGADETLSLKTTAIRGYKDIYNYTYVEGDYRLLLQTSQCGIIDDHHRMTAASQKRGTKEDYKKSESLKINKHSSVSSKIISRITRALLTRCRSNILCRPRSRVQVRAKLASLHPINRIKQLRRKIRRSHSANCDKRKGQHR